MNTAEIAALISERGLGAQMELIVEHRLTDVCDCGDLAVRELAGAIFDMSHKNVQDDYLFECGNRNDLTSYIIGIHEEKVIDAVARVHNSNMGALHEARRQS